MKLGLHQAIEILSLIDNPQAILAYIEEHQIDANAEIVIPMPNPENPTEMLTVESTILATMVGYGRTEVAEELIKRGADVNATVKMPALPPFIPFACAIPLIVNAIKDEEMLSLLLKHGAKVDVSFRSLFGQTNAWQLMALTGCDNIVKKMIKKDVDLMKPVVSESGQKFNIFQLLANTPSKAVRAYYAKVATTVRSQAKSALDQVEIFLGQMLMMQDIGQDIDTNAVTRLAEYKQRVDQDLAGCVALSLDVLKQVDSKLQQHSRDVPAFVLNILGQLIYATTQCVKQMKLIEGDLTPEHMRIHKALQQKKHAISMRAHQRFLTHSLLNEEGTSPTATEMAKWYEENSQRFQPRS